MVPTRQLKLPSINLVAIAIQMFVLMPNRALNTALQQPPKPVSKKKKREIKNSKKKIHSHCDGSQENDRLSSISIRHYSPEN